MYLSIKMTFNVNNKKIIYEMQAAVLSDLKNQIIIGSHFLKKHNVTLEFSNDKPIKMHFKNIGFLKSVSSIGPVSSLSKEYSDHMSQSNVPFSQLKNKIFCIKADKSYFLAPNTISLIHAYVEGDPLNNFCGIVLPHPSNSNPELCGGLLRRIVPPRCFSFEFKC